MKKLIMLFAVLMFGMNIFAQIGAVKTVVLDTTKGNQADTSAVIAVSGDYSVITFQSLCTQLGGTTDGSIRWQGSVDGLTYMPLIDNSVDIVSYPNDTLTMTNGAIQSLSVLRAKYKYYRSVVTGTASDTTLVTQKYILK
jgi:hypothetical protein